MNTTDDVILTKIRNNLARRMKNQPNSLCATDDEVTIAWLIAKIDELDPPKAEVGVEEVMARNDVPLESLTCHHCGERNKCRFVDDWYNTHGDCLAMK